MKYNFIFDKEFDKNNLFELSEMERFVVLATILGGHNAIFYGYKPERLIKAIKALRENFSTFEEVPLTTSIVGFCGGGPNLSKGYITKADGGYLYMKDLLDFRTSVLQMAVVPMREKKINLCRDGLAVQYPADFQLIATTRTCDCGNYLTTDKVCLCSARSVRQYWNKGKSIIEKCGIVYFCKEDDTRCNFSRDELRTKLSICWDFHVKKSYLGSKKNQEIDSVEQVEFTSEAKELFSDLRKTTSYSEEILLNIAKVARTLADINRHSLVFARDVMYAKKWYAPLM